MNNIKDFQKCSNCGACYNICPANAISVNEKGLFYSLDIDEKKCISCGICKKVCPVNNPRKAQTTLHAYGAINNDGKTVKNSSSGGVFRAIADLIIGMGGVVYGAAYSDDFKDVKICSSAEVPLNSLQKSKYVESQSGLSFKEVEDHLKNNKIVLYCGAPCQIAGLICFLKKNYDNLLTCDFSCGGMPSHKLYREWLDNIERKLRSPICNVDFRPKTFGWYPHAVKVDSRNGRSYNRLSSEDPFFDCFIGTPMSIRDYCLECEFADNHYSDIILADFWKYKSVSQIENKNKGISLVITNSSKGEYIINKLSKQVAMTSLCLKKASYNLRKKKFSSEFIEKRKFFLTEYEKNGFISTQKKRKYMLMFRLKCKLKKVLGKV